MLATAPTAVLPRPRRASLASLLRHEAQSNGLSCVRPRSGQPVRSVKPPRSYLELRFIPAVGKRAYNILPLRCSSVPSGTLIANHSGISCRISDWEPACFCAVRNFSNAYQAVVSHLSAMWDSQKCYLCVLSCRLAWVGLNSSLIALGVLWICQ